MVETQKLQSSAPVVPFNLELAQELLAIYSSPLYVYQGSNLRETINYITESIPYPRTQFHFASVTNGNVALLQIFQSCGWGLHANTPGDIYLGLKAGFAPNQIVYSGSNLSHAEMEQLLKWGITTFNLDSLAQLQTFCDVYEKLENYLFPNSPFPIPHSQFPIPNSPFPIPHSQFPRNTPIGIAIKFTRNYRRQSYWCSPR